MNCQAIQNKILNLPDPRVIPSALLSHVAGCEVCRAWAHQAARLEALLEQLPVPPAPGNKKNEMIDELTSGELVFSRSHTAPARESFAGSVLKFIEQNKMVIGGLAAAILVVLGGWWVLTGDGTNSIPQVAKNPKDPFLEKIKSCDVALMKPGTTTNEKLDILGDMAEALSNQTRSLARVADQDELTDLARWYDKVVNAGMVNQAKLMPFSTMTIAEQKKRKEQLNNLAAKLGETADQAEKLTEVPPDAKPVLQKIMKSARDGELHLRELANKN
jgi:hypothetical protein